MQTISHEPLQQNDVEVVKFALKTPAVDLSRTQVVDLLERARGLKHKVPGFALPPLTHAADRTSDGVVRLQRPVDALADLLTMSDRSGLPLEDIAFCLVGDGSSGIAESLLLAGTLLGMDVRVATSQRYWPSDFTIEKANQLAAAHQGQLMVTPSTSRGIQGADFVVATSPARRTMRTTITEVGQDGLVGVSLAREQALNRLWVLDAVLVSWLELAPGQTWTTAASE